ncbi:hypothetical protein ABEF85_05115 [Acinetobacter thermotolerans]|uniref:hypothetical protein n=1 Tax=Acinetobacter thermotolerans TaxID=3151487 RepID=UPI00325B25BF
MLAQELQTLQQLPANKKAEIADIFLGKLKHIESLAIQAKTTPSLKNINDLRKAETDFLLSVLGGIA